MKKQSMVAIIMFILCMGIYQGSFAAQTPDYQKYGNIAMAVVKADYPGEEVREYQYVGREKKTETDVTDLFRFQVKENGKVKNVIVRITHNINDKKLLTLQVTEEKN
jgi:hypothetical protein